MRKKPKLLAVGLATAVVVAVGLFMLIGRGGSDVAAVASPRSDMPSSGVAGTEKGRSPVDVDDVAARSGATTAGSDTTSNESSSVNGSSSAPKGSSPSTKASDPVGGAAGTVADLEDYVVGKVTDALGGIVPDGLDLDEVTDAVIALMEDGLSLENAVDQVLGTLGSLVPLPTSPPSGGLIGGLLGG